MTPADQKPRGFVPPLGWPFDFRATTITPADCQSRPVILNRYPRQVIGIAIRLPDHRPLDASKKHGNHRALSLVWSKPARWWK